MRAPALGAGCACLLACTNSAERGASTAGARRFGAARGRARPREAASRPAARRATRRPARAPGRSSRRPAGRGPRRAAGRARAARPAAPRPRTPPPPEKEGRAAVKSKRVCRAAAPLGCSLRLRGWRELRRVRVDVAARRAVLGRGGEAEEGERGMHRRLAHPAADVPSVVRLVVPKRDQTSLLTPGSVKRHPFSQAAVVRPSSQASKISRKSGVVSPPTISLTPRQSTARACAGEETSAWPARPRSRSRRAPPSERARPVHSGRCEETLFTRATPPGRDPPTRAEIALRRVSGSRSSATASGRDACIGESRAVLGG